MKDIPKPKAPAREAIKKNFAKKMKQKTKNQLIKKQQL